MNTIRAQINSALEALIEEKNGIAFQRLACQCLKSRWPTLMATAEQADCGEDALTVLSEGADGIIRSLACSLTATHAKISSDAGKIAKQHPDVKEFVFATPKSVTRKIQLEWEKKIAEQYGWKLIVVERSEFLAILEHPRAQWICAQHLNLALGYSHCLKSAEELRDLRQYEAALKRAQEAETGAFDSGDWESLCRAQLLITEIHLARKGLGEEYANLALQALTTAREHKLDSLMAECLIQRANSLMGNTRKEARKLLDEALAVVGDDNKTQRWLYLNLAELEQGEGRLDEAEAALRKWEEIVGNNGKIDRQSFFHTRFRIEAARGNYTEALNNINCALRRARSKRRTLSIGWMLHEKARFLARKGDLRRAALEAEKARKVFEESNILRESFDSALLAGHFFLECKDGERALGLADYVLTKASPEQFENSYQNALQLKTKALQVLKRIDDALKSNRRYRDFVAHKPQALVVADIQDAMLLAQAGQYERAEEFMEKCFQRAKETKVQEEIVAAIKVHWAQIKMHQAKDREARKLAEEALVFADRLPPNVRDDAAHIAKTAADRAPLTSLYEDLLNDPNPLILAGTQQAKTIQEAHRKIVGTLLEWGDVWPKALQELYDFWGRGNLARYILNHRGFENAFHVTVEATTVAEARQWTKVLCPLVDVLTILWKGPVLSGGMALVPIHHSYEAAGGWGYSVCAGDNWRPDKNSDDWNWSPAMGWATLLPRDAVEFLFREARGFFEAGSLFLLPALNVGCIDPGHGAIERMFTDSVNANPFLSQTGNNNHAQAFDFFPLPYFPDVPLDELSAMVKGEGDSLLETRLCLREWARTLRDPDKIETRSTMVEIRERIESEMRRIARKFALLSRKLEWAEQEGKIQSYSFDAGNLRVTPSCSAAEEMIRMHDELQGLPWYAYFRLSAQDYRWDLMRDCSKSSRRIRERPRPEGVHHWLVPPKPGWTTPIAILGCPSK